MTTATTVRYEPRGAARALFTTRAAEVLLDGPAGTGKSLAALWRLHLTCLKHPGARCLIVRKTAVSLGSTTLVTFEEQVIPAAMKEGVVRWYGGSQKEAAAYRYSNGSRIVVGGMDKPEKVLSSEYDLVFCDEATELTVTDWETINSRLRHGKVRRDGRPSHQQIAATNPAHPQHWINQRANTDVMERLVSRHRDNPRYFHADGTPTEEGAAYMARLDALTGVRRHRLRDGIWAAAEGIIYERFDASIHVVDQFQIPADWTRYWSVDFGFTHPFVLQCWAEDPDGRLYLYREIFRTQRLVEDHAADIIAACTEPDPDYVHPEGRPRLAHHGRIWTEPRPRAVICDHDAEDRATLERHLGMSTVKARKGVSDGIQAVQSRWKVAGDGRPRLFLVRGAVLERDAALVEARKPACTEEEIPAYVWAVRPGGELKEEPRKEEDDGCDALRYMVAHRDLRGRPRVRVMSSR